MDIRIETPKNFHFEMTLDVRIGDLNYGGHLGIVELQHMMHEARVQTLDHFGHSEDRFGEGRLVLNEVWVKQISECFRGDSLHFRVAVVNVSKVRFDLFYHIRKAIDGREVASGITTMALLSQQGRPIRLPEDFVTKATRPSL
jgi:acyl-CoA thioesterase FadM